MIILPRQARDKHRKVKKKRRMRFLTGTETLAAGHILPPGRYAKKNKFDVVTRFCSLDNMALALD